MVNNSDLISLVNNKKTFELVQELKEHEIKKSPLSSAARNKVVKKYGGDYQSSRMSSEDIALMQMYGPGFWDDFLKPVTSVALAISYAIPPVAAVTIPLSVGVGVAGATMATLSDDKDVKDVGRQMLGTVGQAAVSHLSGDGVEYAGNAKLIVEHIGRNV